MKIIQLLEGERFIVFMRHDDYESVLANNATRHEAIVAAQNAIKTIASDDSEQSNVTQDDENNWSVVVPGVQSNDYTVYISIEPVTPGNVYGSD